MAHLVVAREESGGGEVGTKMWSAPPTARYPPPKRRAVSARRRFPPGCGRDAAALLAGANDGSPFGDARADGGSAPPQKTDAASAPLAGSKDGVLLEAFSPTAAPGALGKVIAADGAGTMADGGCHGLEAGVAKSSEASGRNGSQGIARSGSQQLVPAMRLLPKPTMVSAKRPLRPGCGRVSAKVMNKSGRSSCNVVAESLAEDPSKKYLRGKKVSESPRMDRASYDVPAGVSGSGKGSMMRSKVMLTPREVVEPTKVTQGKEVATVRGSFGPRKKEKVKDSAHLLIKVASARTLGNKEILNDKMVFYLEDDDILEALAVQEGKLELYVNSSSAVPSMRCQRQYGIQNPDARSKVKMMRKRFEFIWRSLAKAVEQHSLMVRRIDFAAGKAIKKLPGFTKHGPIVGKVPGVEIGDEFLYRVELAIVGLHRPYQGGIDTTKDRNGVLIAISIVASGGYPDELSCSGELIYIGSGGKPAGKKDDEDQKLERGNLALKNCIETKTPVRVIHGFKCQNREEGIHLRAKEISTFTYDGLYHVVGWQRAGQRGSKVFKYELQRIPGQPELPHCSKTAIMR
ncbi:uncharacterized protein LOC133895109 [Phragmites australis]|uniref:uncharacterized protein LOC133895109 n=1 Tax=Phragmites australis TaxID=29695 RepID=UPI002D777665|nr:uncharacterized protein LOC133895109 [Phragmites australis]